MTASQNGEGGTLPTVHHRTRDRGLKMQQTNAAMGIVATLLDILLPFTPQRDPGFWGICGGAAPRDPLGCPEVPGSPLTKQIPASHLKVEALLIQLTARARYLLSQLVSLV